MPNPTSKLNLVINGTTTQLDIHDANAVDLTNNQTVAGDKEFTGTTTAHDLVPSATDTYNFGSSSYQWNNAYIKSLTINGVACGDILTHNASEFVDVSTAQTIAGVKTFSDGVVGNVSGTGALTLQAKNGTARIYLRDNLASNFPNTVNLYSTVDGQEYGVFLNGGSFHPISNDMNLGVPARKWKTFNGLNPGALSLPSGTVGMNLIGDVSLVGTEKKLSKDITVTGFVYVDVSFSSSTSSNRLNLYNDTKKYGIWVPCNSGRIRQIMPISAGDRLEFNVLDGGTTINAIQLFTCQGNV